MCASDLRREEKKEIVTNTLESTCTSLPQCLCCANCLFSYYPHRIGWWWNSYSVVDTILMHHLFAFFLVRLAAFGFRSSCNQYPKLSTFLPSLPCLKPCVSHARHDTLHLLNTRQSDYIKNIPVHHIYILYNVYGSIWVGNLKRKATERSKSGFFCRQTSVCIVRLTFTYTYIRCTEWIMQRT